jgi:hypothetical protein
MTGTYSVTCKSGRAEVGQFDAMFKPRKVTPSRFPLLAFHGANSSWFQWMDSTWPNLHRFLVEAAKGGIPSVAAQAGGTSTYANDTAMTGVNSDLTAIGTAMGCSTSKAHLIGASMGGAVATRWAINNPTKVATMTLLIPMTSILNTYELNTGGLRAAIGTAWGVTYPTPLPAGANLLGNAGVLAGIPTRMYYAPDDTLINPTDVLALKDAIGPSATATASSGGGHTNAGMLPVGFDFDAWVAWLLANGS